MSKSTPTAKVYANGLTAVQRAAKRHFTNNPDNDQLDTRVIDAKSFLTMVPAFLNTLTRPKLDAIYRATFNGVTDWDACVQWADDPADDGYAPSNAVRRLWKQFAGWEVPKGMRVHHSCHIPSECADGIFCTHRACVNPLHLYLTTPKGLTSKSHNAKLGKGKKLPEYMLTWTVCKYGHDTVPGKACTKCNAIRQANFRTNAAARRAEREAALAAELAAELDRDLFDELVTPDASELTALGYWVTKPKTKRAKKAD
ncbi:hypothetical protein SAMN04489743_2820 [Pseudarthrobacter equi]|uniref:Uncharacterized protein n=1 Tax=Pseudarthrobacter equi TaxID=728066 RepID=A0A1H2A716_9MICC|nr:hypothetical protein [Pseudarthrobacter equi]SDT41679.1 hypothetical protein SAMN04489743_2820 [Pseudarthrobacter equi]